MMEQLDTERTKRLVAMGEMAASLAHEIRNPLGSMELFCSLLKKDLKAQPDLLYLAEQIHRGIRTLDQVIANSLSFVRSTTPQRKFISDIKPILEEVALNASSKSSHAGIEVVTEHLGDGAAYFDPFQIQQALLNLTLNAIDATAEVQRQCPVVISSVVEPDGSWAVKVSDSGVGISEENQKKVFDPFFTNKSQGTGLGLAIVFSIVAAHGGTIFIESELGAGTTISLRFPPAQERA